MIRVLIMDHTEIGRETLEKILSRDPAIRIVGKAKNGLEGIELVRKFKPDLITLDIAMPVMGGVRITELVMAYQPTPILIVFTGSSREDMEQVFMAINRGALDMVDKNSLILGRLDSGQADEFIRQVKSLVKIKVVTHLWGRRGEAGKGVSGKSSYHKIVAIAASTGGPKALLQILSKWPTSFPAGIVIVQHMSDGFIEGMADWLGRQCHIKIKVAENGDHVTPGRALIAPSGFHMKIGYHDRILLECSDPINGHIPSADLLLSSVAKIYGKRSIGVILTGMGADGAEGIKAIKQMGGITIAQDEESCIVFGMPRAAVEMEVVDHVFPLEGIAPRVLKMI